MKERIEELAREAGWEQARTSDDCMACGVFDLHKFAKLIRDEALEMAARECEKKDCVHLCAVGHEFAAAIRKLKV